MAYAWRGGGAAAGVVLVLWLRARICSHACGRGGRGARERVCIAAPVALPRGRGRRGAGGSRPRRRAAPTEEGQLLVKGKEGRTSVSCPFMESICSWRPAIVARRSWSVILLAAFAVFARCCDDERWRQKESLSLLKATGPVFWLGFFRLIGSGASGLPPTYSSN